MITKISSDNLLSQLVTLIYAVVFKNVTNTREKETTTGEKNHQPNETDRLGRDAERVKEERSAQKTKETTNIKKKKNGTCDFRVCK